MMKPVYRLVVIVVIVKLRMVVGLHELARREIVDHGWNARDRHGEIVRHGLDGTEHSHAFRIHVLSHTGAPEQGLQKIRILVHRAYGVFFSVCVSRQFEIKICRHLSPPFRMDDGNLLPRAG